LFCNRFEYVKLSFALTTVFFSFDAPLQRCTNATARDVQSEAAMMITLIVMNNFLWLYGRRRLWNIIFVFFIFQSHKLMKTYFDRMIYNNIVSCFVCVSGCFAAVQYIGDINSSNPRGVQKVHTRTHIHIRERRHIFLAVLLLNKFFFLPCKVSFRSWVCEEEREWLGMVEKSFDLLCLRHYRRARIPVVYHLICNI